MCVCVCVCILGAQLSSPTDDNTPTVSTASMYTARFHAFNVGGRGHHHTSTHGHASAGSSDASLQRQLLCAVNSAINTLFLLRHMAVPALLHPSYLLCQCRECYKY